MTNTLLMGLILTSAIIGQDMPQEMKCPDDAASSPTLHIELETPTSTFGVTAYATYNTEDRRVWVEVAYRDYDGFTDGYAETSQEHSLAFQPTAIAKVADLSNAFFVIGYAPRLDRVLVERWVIDAATSRTPTPSGTYEKLGISFSVAREVVWIADVPLHNQLPSGNSSGATTINPHAVGYISGAAFNIADQRLWMIEEAVPSRVWALDPSSGTVTEIYSSATYPALEKTKLLSMLYVDPTHSSGGGVVVLAVQGRVWEALSGIPDVPAMIFQDANLDGLAEIVFETTTTEYYDLGYISSAIDYGPTLP